MLSMNRSTCDSKAQSRSVSDADLKLVHYINLKLALMGLPQANAVDDHELIELSAPILSRQKETSRLLADYLCPADHRVVAFLQDKLSHCGVPIRLPSRNFVLDRSGLARVLSLPPDADEYKSDIVSSYRTRRGVLHNPRNDRRTTQGVFHIAEGGLPIPADKVAVPVIAFARLLEQALNPPAELLRLPFTSNQEEQAECFVSLLLRPIVCPGVPGYVSEKSMEIRFLAPGSMVGNLDFVESIFGNGGDPFLPENDPGLDPKHWTGHTGCVILAPHLTKLTKRALGLPHWDDATPRQRRDGVCWKNEAECYNDGKAFKITCRDERGVIVTLIADNYFGYCKKEVKTQISYSANLHGLCEEEHAGGALVFASYDLGEEFSGHLHMPKLDHTFEEVVAKFGSIMDVKPEGYGIDKKYPDIVYVPSDVHLDLRSQSVSWTNETGEHSIKLHADKTYVRPSGYKIQMEKPPGGRAWRLVGTLAEGTLCHKPCTVSGGGKSEISKPITDAILHGPVFVNDFQRDFDDAAELIEKDYSDRFKDPLRCNTDSRAVLSSERSLGSVIKLLTPSIEDYTHEYNVWLQTIPQYVKELVFVVKRFYKPEWGADWRSHFSVDIVNGTPGKELKCDNRKLISIYLRVGYEQDGSWRVFGLRKDFHPSVKWQFEDDITASLVVPGAALKGLNPLYQNPSVKFVKNCETKLFQRPDDAIIPGYDHQTEEEFSRPGNFFSNYEPLTSADARELVDDAINFDRYTDPMQQVLLEAAASDSPRFVVSTGHPRIVDGKPSKNPRFLQTRPDLDNPRSVHLAEMAIRLNRFIPPDKPLLHPVNAVLPGRRNNPPDPASGIRPLAVFNPVHYMELPELFMEFICSITGKSPSTTGAGSEGALTKGPFNALHPILDLNNALVSAMLTGYEAFITAAGHVGPHLRVDHDISLLIPEIWSRMTVRERDPRYLIQNGYLERVEDFTHNGRTVMASRLGYRITARFVNMYFGRVFNHPHLVFSEAMLRPEQQDPEVYLDGVDNIVSTHQRVAQLYFEDGGVELACPPLKALLHIMAHGHYEGKGIDHPQIRAMFHPQRLSSSAWYESRLQIQQAREISSWERHVAYLESFLARPQYEDEARRLNIQRILTSAKDTLARVSSPAYADHLHGTLGGQLLNFAPTPAPTS